MVSVHWVFLALLGGFAAVIVSQARDLAERSRIHRQQIERDTINAVLRGLQAGIEIAKTQWGRESGAGGGANPTIDPTPPRDD